MDIIESRHRYSPFLPFGLEGLVIGLLSLLLLFFESPLDLPEDDSLDDLDSEEFDADFASLFFDDDSLDSDDEPSDGLLSADADFL